jgi:hypothetical protein
MSFKLTSDGINEYLSLPLKKPSVGLTLQSERRQFHIDLMGALQLSLQNVQLELQKKLVPRQLLPEIVGLR